MAASIEQKAAVVELSLRVPKARVDFDPVTSSPRMVSVQDGFLTRSTEQSQALAVGAAAAVQINGSNQPIRVFLEEQRNLFGHGPEVLDQARVVRDYVTKHNGMRTVVWQQEVDGIPVFESVLVAHTTKRGELINISSGFVPDPVAAADAGTSNRALLVAAPPIAGAAAVLAAARNVGESISEGEVESVGDAVDGPEKKQGFRAQPLRGETAASLVWVALGRAEFRLCWDVILTSRLRGEMFRVLVDAQSGKVIIRRGLTRYISDASYRVYTSDSPSPFSPGHSTPLTTQPALTNRALLTLPALSTNASPNGWINDGINETRGNNVDAHSDRNDDDSPDLPRPTGSPFRVFDFAMNPAAQDPTNYIPAAVTQLFYLCNWYHDRLYELGFTEAAGNFQINNFGRGGLGNDPVQADGQDGGGVNNANFSTPPDGSSGRMQMYIFSGPNPRRDGDFDAEIVFHEYTHGLSWRLVGGGQGLGTSQSDGMGEGWSDFYALALLSEPGDNVNGCYAAGGYATYQLSGLTANYYYGIRRYPYSTDMTKNPLTFKDIDTSLASPHTGIPRSPIIGTSPSEVHNQGEVWCVTLWEARANLVNKYGWAVGNQLILQLVTDGMKLSPPAPNFLQARDAILQADLVNNGGANRNELWAAFAKRGMGSSAISPNSNSNNGIVEAYDVPDDLFINPSLILTSSGPVGGPFSPNPVPFMLTNTGNSSLSWSLLNTSTWITVQPSSGTLLPGDPAVSVNVTIGAVATTFPLGAYNAGVAFTNHTSGVSQSRLFRLAVVGGSMFDDFDPDVDLTQWSAFGGVVGSTVAATNSGGFISPPNSLWFGASGSRFATTVPVDATGGGSISFWLRLGSGSFPWEMVDLPGEGVVLEYSINGGSTWAIMVTCNTSTFYNWTQVSNSIPVGARSNSTLFRWRQLNNSGSDFDHWALDDVTIDAGPASTLTLSVPGLATEGDAPLTGTVTASPTPTSDVTVNLNSSDPTEASVPSVVIISAGSASATFDITIQDDAELDGFQTATVTASAGGHQGGNASLLVRDNETAVLAVALPATASESAGTIVGTVGVSAPPDANILISLNSSDTSEMQVPTLVVLPSGQTSVVFNVTVVNDNLIDGPQNASITAQVTNWTAGVESMTVLDNETLDLSVSLPAGAYENVGVLTGGGMVGISGILPTNLTVSLQSSDLTEATVPVSATIIAGQTNRAFNLTMVDDAIVDGAQNFRITASAAGFLTASNIMSALDDESPPPPTNPLPSNLASNIVANTSLSWSNVFAGVTNDIYFGTAPGAGLVFLGSTTGTNWTLPLLAPNTTYYWRIVVRRMGSSAGPVWRFTTRGVNHFVWAPIASPKYVSEPFNVTVTAKDQFETTVSNFTGLVNLSAANAGLVTNKVIGDISHTDTSTGNYTLAFAITPSTNLTVTHVRSYSGTKVSIWSNAGTLLASQNVSGPNGSWTETLLATPLQLLGGTTYRVSFYTGGSGPYYYNSNRPAIFPNGTLVNGYYYASGDVFPNTFYSADKVIFLCDLRYTVTGAASIPITPTITGAFVNGAWTGDLSVLSPTTNLVLRAADGSSHVGLSSPFNVLLQNDISVAVTDSPDPVSIGGNVTYAISVNNSGPAAAAGVTVTNLLPASATVVSVLPSQGTVTTNGNTLVCSLGSLAGNTANVVIIATVNSSGGISNRVTVSRTDPDAYLPNNSAVAVTAVQVPAIAVSDVTVYEGSAGSGSAAFVVTVTPAPAVAVSVNFSTLSGSAVAPADFLNTNGVLNFAIGQTTKTVPVAIVGDSFYELDETFTLNLSGAVNASLADSQAVGTIRNDDPMPTVSIGDVYLKEGNAGTTNAVFPVALSAASGLGVTVNYVTINGNATSGSDYVARSGSLTIPAGATTNSVAISLNGDLQIESDEVFYVDLSAPANAILLKREGVGLIVNDDGLPGQIDHFSWSALAPTQYVGIPFAATISALDAFNFPATNFNGIVSLTGLVGGGQVTNLILGNQTHSTSFSGTFTLGYSFTPNTNLTVTHFRRYFGSKISIWTATGTLVASQNVTGSNGVWSETALTNPVQLLAGTTYRVAAYTGGGSYYFRNDGLPTFPHGSIHQSYELGSDGFPTSISSGVAWWFVDLRYTVGTSLAAPISPTVTGPFVNGSWTGNITALATATNLTIKADDGAAHTAMSSPMMVILRDDLGVTVQDVPDPVSVGGDLSYVITVTNIGPAVATGVVLSNQLPAGVVLQSVTPSQGTSTTNGSLVVCALGSLPANSAATVVIGVGTTAPGTLTNHATVHRAEADAFAGNNSALTLTTVQFPVVSVNSAAVAEGNSGLTPLVFTVSVSPPPATNVSVNFATTNGTALAGDDYLATNGIFNFAIGQTTQAFAVQIRGDTNVEPVETFSVRLSNPANATLGQAGTGSILNDDSLGRVAIYGAPSTDAWNNDVWFRVLTGGNFDQVDAFLVKPGYALPTLSQLQQYAAVLVYSDTSFADGAALGDVLADYIDGGGGVVLCTFGFFSSSANSIQGRIKTGNYLPFTTDGSSTATSLTLIPDAPSHPLLNGVTVFNGGSSSYHNNSISIANGATLVAHWSNGQPLVGAKESANGRIVGLNFYPPSTGTGRSDFWPTNTHGGLLLANALAWASQAGPNTNPPTIWQQPSNYTAFEGGAALFTVGATGGYPVAFQWRKNSSDLIGQTNTTLTLLNVQTNDAGDYTVRVSNPYGATMSALAVLTVNPLPPSADFWIVSLTPNNSAVVDHNGLTGDDRGGIAASSSQVFYSGDNATARFSLVNLSGGAGIGRVNDGMVSDLRTEQMYHLANGTTLLTGPGTVTTLAELSGTTGLATGNVIPLSAPIVMNSGSGIFAGYGRIVLHNGSRVYEVILPSGAVLDRGAMGMPSHQTTENWAFWGVAENYNSSLYLVYVQNYQTIARTQVPSGVTTTLATFSDLSDMACLTVSLSRNRWYFHYEGSGQFGGSSETIGYADAAFSLTGTSNSPVILAQPASQSVVSGGTASFGVSVVGTPPLSYQWRKNGAAISQATNAILTVLSVQTNDSGSAYSVLVTNAFGWASSSNALLTVIPGARVNALLIWDTINTGTVALSNALANAGISVTLSATDESSYTGGNPSPTGFGAVILLNGTTYSSDMPAAGQIALSNYVQNGGGYLQSEWDAYEFGDGRMQRMRDLVLFDRDYGSNGTVNLSTVAGQEGHPVLVGLPTNFTFQAGFNVGLVHPFATNPATVLMRDESGSDAVAVRNFGSGRVVGFHHAGNYDFDTLSSPYVQQLYVNGLLWASKLAEPHSPLRFVSSESAGGSLYFWLGTEDGSPIMPDRAAGIDFYCSVDVTPPMTNWVQMTNSVLLTNDLLRLTVPNPLGSALFIRAQENP